MLYLFVLSISFALIVSFLCSLTEAALYAVPLTHVRHLAESGVRSGKVLLRLKADIARPIGAVLLLNTVANTAGAAIAGAQADQIWGKEGLLIFSILFTIGILFVGEIGPKVLGVTYSKTVAVIVALPLSFMIKILAPVIYVTQYFSSIIRPDVSRPTVSEEEVLSLAAIGTEEGTLNRLEGSVISNIIGLNQTLVRDVLTPRTSVFKLEDDLSLFEAEKHLSNWEYTRVPLYSDADPDHLNSYVRQRDVYRALLNGKQDSKLKEIARPLLVVPELTSCDRLLTHMFEKKEHIASVVDEHGALAGIITLEDIIEEIIGQEIQDEYD